MERKIGEIFEYEGKKIEVVENENPFVFSGCWSCYFEEKECENINELGKCFFRQRQDRKGVYFVEVEDGK